MIRLYREADWVPEWIPEEDIPEMSCLTALRISEAKIVQNSSGKKSIEEAPLVARMKAIGLKDEDMLRLIDGLRERAPKYDEIPEELLAAAKLSVPEGYTIGPP